MLMQKNAKFPQTRSSEPKFLVVFKGKPDFKTEIMDKINKVRQPRANESSEREIFRGFY